MPPARAVPVPTGDGRAVGQAGSRERAWAQDGPFRAQGRRRPAGLSLRAFAVPRRPDGRAGWGRNGWRPPGTPRSRGGLSHDPDLGGWPGTAGDASPRFSLRARDPQPQHMTHTYDLRRGKRRGQVHMRTHVPPRPALEPSHAPLRAVPGSRGPRHHHPGRGALDRPGRPMDQCFPHPSSTSSVHPCLMAGSELPGALVSERAVPSEGSPGAQETPGVCQLQAALLRGSL